MWLIPAHAGSTLAELQVFEPSHYFTYGFMNSALFCWLLS